jgi:hypothetical protein
VTAGACLPSMRWLYTLYTGPRRRRSGIGQLLPFASGTEAPGVASLNDGPTTGQLLALLGTAISLCRSLLPEAPMPDGEGQTLGLDAKTGHQVPFRSPQPGCTGGDVRRNSTWSLLPLFSAVTRWSAQLHAFECAGVYVARTSVHQRIRLRLCVGQDESSSQQIRRQQSESTYW